MNDPSDAGPIVAAVLWFQGIMLGTIATAVATIAVAITGALMLQGRIDRRRGVTVILGCFVLFGASSIARGITSNVAVEPFNYDPQPPPQPLAINIPQGDVSSYDPYAGAAPALRPPPPRAVTPTNGMPDPSTAPPDATPDKPASAIPGPVGAPPRAP